jgi:hypothetical protein
VQGPQAPGNKGGTGSYEANRWVASNQPFVSLTRVALKKSAYMKALKRLLYKAAESQLGKEPNSDRQLHL